MKNRFKVYAETRGKTVLESFHAYQIIMARSQDKYAHVYYLDGAGTVRCALMTADISLAKIMAAHEDGFIKIRRDVIVNKEHLLACIKTTNAEGHAYGKVIIRYMDKTYYTTRRSTAEVQKLIKEKQCA